jgi:methylmalonyl-CoA mutase N-terminal domain/subunit
MEREAEAYFRRIDTFGGVIPAIEAGFFQKEIALAARRYQDEIEKEDRFIVGVNAFDEKEEKLAIPILRIAPEMEDKQRDRVRELRASRDQTKCRQALDDLRHAARGDANLMPHFVACSRSYVTIGEMVAVLKAEFGEYKEPIIF